MSGKTENEFLESLGASEVVARGAFEEKARPLNKELYAGAVDVAGGNILANILSMTKKYGMSPVIACRQSAYYIALRLQYNFRNCFCMWIGQ